MPGKLLGMECCRLTAIGLHGAAIYLKKAVDAFIEHVAAQQPAAVLISQLQC